MQKNNKAAKKSAANSKTENTIQTEKIIKRAI